MPFHPEGIIQFRELLNLSRKDLAGELGVGENTVGRWETGESTPTAAHLGKLLDLADQRKQDHPFYRSPASEALAHPAIRVPSIFLAESQLQPDRILVVADWLRVPDKLGAETTRENFKRGARYCFVLSKGKTSQVEEEFKPWIGEVLNSVRGQQEKVDEFAQFTELNTSWDYFPAIYYRYSDPDEPHAKRVVGLLGDEVGAPISSGYVALTETAAKSLLKHVRGQGIGESAQEFLKQLLHAAHFDERVDINERRRGRP